MRGRNGTFPARIWSPANPGAGAEGIPLDARHAIRCSFLREAAHTLRHSLSSEHFVGRWGDDEFVVVLPSANPVTTRLAAETMWSLLTHSEVTWWGDRFPVQAMVTHTVAEPGDTVEKLLKGLEPQHAAVAHRAFGASSAGA